MSLATIINSASAAIQNTDYQISISSNNIANAGVAGYTTKTATPSVITPLLALSSSTVTRATNDYLTQAVISNGSAAARDQAITTSLTNYDTALGSTSQGNDISSQLSALQSALTTLGSSSGSASDKASVVAAAQSVATGIQNLSAQIQSLRSQADSSIGQTVSQINTAASQIATLNAQIVSGTASGSDVTNLEDQRATALQTLSQAMGVTYYTTPDNQLQVYTTGGAQLVGGTSAYPLSYTASSSLSASATYPSQIPGITLGGQDITTSITSGTLGGLIALRDQTYPQQQAQLDSYASALITTANAATNSGTAYPPPASLTGSTVVNATDPFSAVGTLRVAVTDSSCAVVNSQDISLSGMSTVSDLVTALNGVPGISASINAQGQLSVSTTGSGTGVALADMGAMVAPNGAGVSSYFGLNNLFSGTNATNIALNANIAANPAALPTGSLSTAATLSAGQVAVASADTSIGNAINKAMSQPTSIAAAGGLPAQTISLQNYASGFVSSAATMISNASNTASTSAATSSAAQTQLQNLTSVNTNQEMANLQSYEQQYQANAQMISMVRSLFTSLMTMMQAA